MSLFWSKTYALAIIIDFCITVFGQNLTTTPKILKRAGAEIKVEISDENTKNYTKYVEATTNTKPSEDPTKAVTQSTIADVTTIKTTQADKAAANVEKYEDNKVTKASEKGFFEVFLLPIRQFIIAILSAEKVTAVLRNIAICIINGGMDLAAHYFPAPLLPMFATIISYLVPIDPVVTLRRKLPVSSYRKAINTGLNSFLKTFDRYKIVVDDDYDDPYMTKRFNRRFNIDSDEMTAKLASQSASITTKKV